MTQEKRKQQESYDDVDAISDFVRLSSSKEAEKEGQKKQEPGTESCSSNLLGSTARKFPFEVRQLSSASSSFRSGSVQNIVVYPNKQGGMAVASNVKPFNSAIFKSTKEVASLPPLGSTDSIPRGTQVQDTRTRLQIDSANLKSTTGNGTIKKGRELLVLGHNTPTLDGQQKFDISREFSTSSSRSVTSNGPVNSTSQKTGAGGPNLIRQLPMNVELPARVKCRVSAAVCQGQNISAPEKHIIRYNSRAFLNRELVPNKLSCITHDLGKIEVIDGKRFHSFRCYDKINKCPKSVDIIYADKGTTNVQASPVDDPAREKAVNEAVELFKRSSSKENEVNAKQKNRFFVGPSLSSLPIGDLEDIRDCRNRSVYGYVVEKRRFGRSCKSIVELVENRLVCYNSSVVTSDKLGPDDDYFTSELEPDGLHPMKFSINLREAQLFLVKNWTFKDILCCTNGCLQELDNCQIFNISDISGRYKIDMRRNGRSYYVLVPNLDFTLLHNGVYYTFRCEVVSNFVKWLRMILMCKTG